MNFLDNSILDFLIRCGILGGILFGVLKLTTKKILSEFKEYIIRARARDEATKCLCRADIISICHKAMRENHIAYYNLENLKHLHDSYKALGGNSSIDTIYAKTIKLPQTEED